MTRQRPVSSCFPTSDWRATLFKRMPPFVQCQCTVHNYMHFLEREAHRDPQRLCFIFVPHPPLQLSLRSPCYSVVASALPFALAAIVLYLGGRCSPSSSTITAPWQCIYFVTDKLRHVDKCCIFRCCFTLPVPPLSCTQVCSLQYHNFRQHTKRLQATPENMNTSLFLLFLYILRAIHTLIYEC